MLGRFDFDRAKVYIDGRKEVLQKLAPTFPNQAQLMAMLATFSHLAEVEKNYHQQPFFNQQTHHSFLPATSFLRKAKSLKDMYNDIFAELQQFETMEHGDASLTGKKPDQHQVQCNTDLNLKLMTQRSIDSTSGDITNSATSSDKDSPTANVPHSPSSAFCNSFFRVLSPISSSVSLSAIQTTTSAHSMVQSGGDPYSLSSSSGYDPPPNSTTTTPSTVHSSLSVREFSDELISHFCRQLQNFIQARLDMVDVYEKLVEASSEKYTSVNTISFRLLMLCRQYHKYFHHPLLAPIKEGMTLECESLMMLIRATIDLQHWRFLPTLFDIQDAQSKLSYWAACTFNKESCRRRFKVSKTQTAPRLYEWLCKFKDFLIAKFTLYFHTTLHSSISATAFKNSCSKLSIDYYSKLSNFQRKIDALFIAIMFDVSGEKDFRGTGYQFPTSSSLQPQGKNTLQPMVVIPAEGKSKLTGLQAEIFMTVITNQQVMTKEGYYQFHDNIKKLTYSVAKLDTNVVLVIVCEGQRSDRDSHIRQFALEMINQFAFLNVFTS